MRLVVAVGLAMLIMASSVPSWAGSEAQESTLSQIGSGVGSGLGTVVYFPFKAVFCIGGGIVSGVTLVVAGRDNANKVVGTACRGTWVITPDAFKGKEPVKFVGDPFPSDLPSRSAP